jgi:hypothetical protein
VDASTGLTNNATPTLSGRLSAELKTGQSLHVFDGDVDLGPAQVSGLGWQFTPKNALAQGEHNLTVRSMAGAQLGPIAAPFKLTIDTLAPTQTGTFSTDLASLTKQGRSVVQGQLSSGLQAGETLAIYDTFNGQRILLGNAKVEGSNWIFETPYALADGSHSFSLSVRDAASNTGLLSQPYNFELDTVAPTAVPISITATSTDGPLGAGSAAVTNDRYPRFSVGELPADVAKPVLVVDGQDWPTEYNAQTGQISPAAAYPLLDGVHTIAVKFADAAGNAGTAGPAMSVTIDATPPNTPAAAPSGYTDDVGRITSASASNTAASTDDTTPGLFVGTGLTDTPKLYVNGTLVAATYNSSTGTLTPNSALTDGNYSFTYSLTDAAGNESTKSATFTLTVDTVTAVSVAENLSTTTAAYTATASMSYALGGADAAQFGIEASSGRVTFKESPNYESPTDANADNVYRITVTGSDPRQHRRSHLAGRSRL